MKPKKSSISEWFFFIALAVAAFYFLSGCARIGHWEANRYAEVPLTKIDSKCRFEVEKATLVSLYRGNPLMTASEKARVYQSCMTPKVFNAVYDSPQ